MADSRPEGQKYVMLCSVTGCIHGLRSDRISYPNRISRVIRIFILPFSSYAAFSAAMQWISFISAFNLCIHVVQSELEISFKMKKSIFFNYQWGLLCCSAMHKLNRILWACKSPIYFHKGSYRLTEIIFPIQLSTQRKPAKLINLGAYCMILVLRSNNGRCNDSFDDVTTCLEHIQDLSNCIQERMSSISAHQTFYSR